MLLPIFSSAATASAATTLSLTVFLASNTGTNGDPRLAERPPLLHFEHNYMDAFVEIDNKRRRRLNDIDGGADICTAEIPPESPLDLRITKAHASHGYNVVRISIITNSAVPPPIVNGSDDKNSELLDWDYSGKFRYRAGDDAESNGGGR